MLKKIHQQVSCKLSIYHESMNFKQSLKIMIHCYKKLYYYLEIISLRFFEYDNNLNLQLNFNIGRW
jgi:hypothetical protein